MACVRRYMACVRRYVACTRRYTATPATPGFVGGLETGRVLGAEEVGRIVMGGYFWPWVLRFRFIFITVGERDVCCLQRRFQ